MPHLNDGASLRVQLDADEQPRAAHLLDVRVVRQRGAQACHQLLATRADGREEGGRTHAVERVARRVAHERPACERAAVVARLHDIRHALRAQHRAWQAVQRTMSAQRATGEVSEFVLESPAAPHRLAGLQRAAWRAS